MDVCPIVAQRGLAKLDLHAVPVALEAVQSRARRACDSLQDRIIARNSSFLRDEIQLDSRKVQPYPAAVTQQLLIVDRLIRPRGKSRIVRNFDWVALPCGSHLRLEVRLQTFLQHTHAFATLLISRLNTVIIASTAAALLPSTAGRRNGRIRTPPVCLERFANTIPSLPSNRRALAFRTRISCFVAPNSKKR